MAMIHKRMEMDKNVFTVTARQLVCTHSQSFLVKTIISLSPGFAQDAHETGAGETKPCLYQCYEFL